MKRVFSMVIALATAVMSYSQSSLVATLNHNGEISAFYGASALQKAYAVSQHGDIITLSGGTFMPVNIEKALTIRGAGMYVDSVAQILPTVISGTFDINISDSVEQRLAIEGIYNDENVNVNSVKDVSFQKSRFKYLNMGGSPMVMTLIHCKVSGSLTIGDNCSVTCVNCYVNFPYIYSYADCEFLNCFLEGDDLYYIRNSNLTNCIINTKWDYASYLPSSSTALYCVGIGKTANNIFSDASNVESTYFEGELNALFKTYTGEYDDNETFELTDAAKALYVGNDLKQVGMYGGNYPFNPTPTNPRIVKCIVAPESTSDGKLSVDIEVSSAE